MLIVPACCRFSSSPTGEVADVNQRANIAGADINIAQHCDYADEAITLSDLRTRWEWDPLRKDPGVQKILAGPEAKTIRK